jgi:NAD(P)-dependent dehydrogenase (short-subunit alcohol dehydrogenase family)
MSSLYARLTRNGPSGFGYGSSAQDVVRELDLAGKTILLTGCNSGIGVEALRAFAGRGATVLGAARDEAKARAACADAPGSVPVACELSEPSSVRACVASVKERAQPLHAIVCNAGIMALPKLSLKHGLELQFLTNHVGHFMLVTGLLDQLAPDGRVVVLSSDAHRAAPAGGIDFDNLAGERGYNGWQAYGRSKLANLLFAKQLARRFRGSARVANAVHPGVISTNLDRHMNPLVGLGLALARPLALKTAAQGAATEVWAAVHPGAARLSGEYLSDCNVSQPRRKALDEELAQRLWARTEEIVAAFGVN